MRFPDQIARRAADWRDFRYYDGPRARQQRLWRRFVGVGAAAMFGEPIEEEIIKAFERNVHQCSGLGEDLMHKVVRRYFRLNPRGRELREIRKR
jgi:hypothetical protein